MYLNSIKIIPKNCFACKNEVLNKHNESVFCIKCWQTLSNAWLEEAYYFNEMPLLNELQLHQKWVAFNFQKNGLMQGLLHDLKYKEQKETAVQLGRMLGQQITSSSLSTCLIPIPIHSKKMKKRGYNQSELVAKGINSVIDIPVLNDHLIRKINSGTQTKKSKSERLQNTIDAFALNKSIPFQHVILVDDLVSTGATLYACAQSILKHQPDLKISIACLGVNDLN